MTLLSIIGEDISQLIPVLYAYREKFTRHILLSDSSTRQRAKKLAKGMHRFASFHKLSWQIDIQIIDETDLSQATKSVQKSLDTFQSCWLNITDAYPMLALLMTRLIQECGGQVISYDHFRNTLHFIDKNQNIRYEQLLPTMNLESYMMLLDYRIVQKQISAELLPNKSKIMTLYKKQSHFKKVRKAILEQHFGQKPRFDISSSTDILNILSQMGILDKNHKLIPKHQKTLQGDLFEEYIFWLCEALHPDDIAMGVKIDFDDKTKEPLAQQRIYNEFDILLIHNNRVFTVECKFSTHLDGLEIVYKYDAIIDYFGKSSKAIIANISSKEKENYLGMKSSSSFHHSTLRRARLSGIHIYHESQVNVAKFQSLVQSFFHIGGKDE